MTATLPASITGVRIAADGKVSIATVPLPAIDEDSVLVKLAAAPINPSDVLFLAGSYPSGKGSPAFAGLEGAGVVVATGAAATAFQGKRVSFFIRYGDQGTWADYAVVKTSGLIPLPDEINDEQGATALVNPLTVELFLLECEKGHHKVVVHNAAASALGLQLIAAARAKGITVINLVRRAENVATVKAEGAEFAIDTTAAEWEDQFRALAAAHNPTAYFDPVGGAAGSKVLSLMPDGSTTFCYGVLGESISYTVPAGEVLFQEKVLRGLWVTKALQNPETAATLVANALSNLASKVYQTTIYKKYPVSQFEAALKDYKANASKGKILLVPSV